MSIFYWLFRYLSLYVKLISYFKIKNKSINLQSLFGCIFVTPSEIGPMQARSMSTFTCSKHFSEINMSPPPPAIWKIEVEGEKGSRKINSKIKVILC